MAALVKNKVNPIVYLLETYPEKDWDFMSLSYHPFITLEYMQSRPDLPWMWDFAASNPNIPPNYVLEHPEDFGNNLSFFQMNPNITLAFVLEHPEIEWDWDLLCNNPLVVTPEYIQSHPEVDWSRHVNALCQNPRITPDFILSLGNVNGHSLSYNRNLTLEFVSAHPEIEWDLRILSMSESMSIKDITNSKSNKWVLDFFLLNPNLTPEMMESQGDRISWNKKLMLGNPNVTLEYVLKDVPKSLYPIGLNPMNRIIAQRVIAKKWRARRKRKAELIYMLGMYLKRIEYYMPELVIKEIYYHL